MNDDPRSVSVIIPNWNGMRYLRTCLDSLGRQTLTDYEILVVDNGSTDGSVELVRDRYPGVRLLRLDRNYGFSEAVNRGVAASRTPYIALLNNDTEADPAWLEQGLRAFESHPEIGFVASQILDFHCRDRLDSAGDILSRTGAALKRGMDQPAGPPYDRPCEVLGASAGAALYRRQVLEQVGPFDSDFFLYLEDVDWCLRAAHLGIRCLYVPEARVYHVEAGSDPLRQASLQAGDSRRRRFHTADRTFWITRNRIRLLVKNYPAWFLLRDLPWLFLGFARSAAFHLLKSRLFGAYCRGLWRGFLEIPRCLPLRRRIQKGRVVSLARLRELFFSSHREPEHA